MPDLPEKVRAYLDALEADRRAALALSSQKAEEAELIKARQDGFRTAMNMLGRHIPDRNIRSSDDPKEPRRRRARRNIAELVVRELSFSGQSLTARQIARAVNYNTQGTETALRRMEKDGQVLREEGGRWVIGMTEPARVNGHAAGASNGKLQRHRAPSEHPEPHRG